MRTAEMLALFEEAETGILTMQDKFPELMDYLLELADYTGPNQKNKIRYGNFAVLVDLVFHVLTFNGVLYAYDEASGLYFEGEMKIREFVQHKLSLFAGAAVCEKFFLLPPTLKLSRETDEILRQVQALNVHPGHTSPFNQYRGVPAANGVVVFDAGGTPALMPYRPEMLFTRKLSAAYHPDADTSAALDLLKSWAGDSYPVLIQIAAQALLQAFPDCTPFKKAYLICGSRNSGKTSFLDFLGYLVGHEHVSHISLQSLDDRFNDSALDGKFLNIGDDLSMVSLRDAGTFKRITGGVWQDVEPKGRARYTARITSAFIYACNRPPGISGRLSLDDAFWDRWILLRFTGMYPKNSSWFSKTALLVLEGYLRLVISEMSQILQNGGELRFLQSAEEVRELWSDAEEPLSYFLDGYTRRDPVGEIPKDRFVDVFASWAAGQAKMFPGKIPTNKIVVSRMLSRLGIEAAQTGSGAQRRSVYKGIRWRDDISFTDDGRMVIDGDADDDEEE